EKAQKGEFALALDLVRRAAAAYDGAFQVAAVLAAREDARVARLAAQKNASASFAQSEIQRAKAFEEKAEARLAAQDYTSAQNDFVEAATTYRSAANAGEIKQALAQAREAAREQRAEAQTGLPQSLTLGCVREAEGTEKDARQAEAANDLPKARD